MEERRRFDSLGTVLISTEAGSEGANLHRKCHLMVNYDLLWNPMRLLQRIGRLDRYGQEHRVNVVNLRSPESWDAQISQKIEQKLAAVQGTMGVLGNEDYRAMILGSLHEELDIAKLMVTGGWDPNSPEVDLAIDESLRSILDRKSTFDNLFAESLGMPDEYGKGFPTLDSDDFRQVFAWTAAKHGVVLRETRNSENQFLKGVHHFTLPEAFRGGMVLN